MTITLTDEQVGWFREQIDLMNEAYNDWERQPWCDDDGDSRAKGVADMLDAILTEHGHGSQE